MSPQNPQNPPQMNCKKSHRSNQRTFSWAWPWGETEECLPSLKKSTNQWEGKEAWCAKLTLAVCTVNLLLFILMIYIIWIEYSYKGNTSSCNITTFTCGRSVLELQLPLERKHERHPSTQHLWECNPMMHSDLTSMKPCKKKQRAAMGVAF